MKEKLFYRVANIAAQEGLWYDWNGGFTGLIHTKYNFCQCHDLPMPYDPEVIGWLSTTDTLEDLYNWFSKEDIKELSKYGYSIVVYRAKDYQFYHNHWIIKQETSILEATITLI